jgi:hypothetical protein
MQLDNTSTLNRGRLFLIDEEKGIVGRWVCTSGLGQHQSVGSWNKQGGGVIPATYQLKNPIAYYNVATKPIDMSGRPGIDSNFYCITPFSVITDGGVQRSDIGIHKDPGFNNPKINTPGTLACLGLPPGEMVDFEKTFKQWTQGEDFVRLLIGYVY